VEGSELRPPLEPDSEPSELTDTVVRGAGLAGGGYIAAQVLTLAFYVVLARLASPDDFGNLAAGTLLVNVGLLFSESGMMAALIHRKDRIDEAASTATVSTIGGGLGLSLLALAAAPLVGILFKSTSTVTGVAAASSGLLFLRSLRVVPEALLQRRFSFLRRVIIEPAGVVIFGATAVVLTANGLGVWGLVLAYYASEGTDAVLSWALVGWRPKLSQASVAMWRELMGYARHILGTAALERGESQIPVLLLGRFVGKNPLGQFRYASRMESTVGSVMVQSASYVLFPAMARITADRDRFRDACERSFRSMCAIGFPLGMLLVPLSLPAALIFFGETWKDAGYAAMALAWCTVAGTPISFASEMLKADGRPDILLRIRAVNTVAITVFMLALLPFGLVGVCGGLSIGTTVAAGYGIVRAGRQLDIPVRRLLGQAWAFAAAAIFMAAVLVPLEFLVIDASSHGTALGILLLAGEGLLGLVLYLLAVRVLDPPGFRELIGIVRRMLRRGGDPEAGGEGGDVEAVESNQTEPSMP
jgi:O-antigen/teichoic acid export membrane protein